MITPNTTTLKGGAAPEAATNTHRKLQRLALEIIQRFAAQGKDLDIWAAGDNVARELSKNVQLIADREDRRSMLARLLNEGAYRYAVEVLETWPDQGAESNEDTTSPTTAY